MLVLGLLWVVTTLAQSRLDSLQHVEEVVVLGRLMHQEVLPAQHLKGEELSRLSTHSVADALRYFSGLQLKDYGGVGGIKTVDIRSMGSHHLGIYYDGIELGNAQNGIIDLGQYSLDNIEEVTLYNGQKSSIFQTASDFGHAGSVYLHTHAPHFAPKEHARGKVSVQYASSDWLRLSGLWEQRLSEHISSSFSSSIQAASGKYKFRYRRIFPDGTTAYDTTAIRQNGDIQSARAEWNLYGNTTATGRWDGKAYFYASDRGIPGAIVNNVWHRGERQKDLNTFIQGRWQKNLGNRFSTRAMAKYAYYRTHYANHDVTQLPVDNCYEQQEAYFSTSNVYELLRHWSASISYDLRWNKLNADTYRFAFPTRWSNLVALASALELTRVQLQGSVLLSAIRDKTHNNSHATRQHRFTPALFANIYPLPTHEFSLHAFVKQSFRMPTFNDLYYTDMGNADLLPERATQVDAGMKWEHLWTGRWQWHAEWAADIYYNTIHDKIIAYPKGQQFRWTMLNLGRVHIKGADVEGKVGCQPTKETTVNLQLQYTFQLARDVTDSRTPYYNCQIPYIPRHSGSATVAITCRQWSMNYSFIYTGERYNGQENIIYNHMEPWYTSDLSLQYRFRGLNAGWTTTLEVNNLFNQDYDVILNYPMPKRNYALKVTVEL